MTKRQTLAIVSSTLLVFGILLATVPFVESMQPTSRAEANLPHIDISNLKPGQFRFEKLYNLSGYGDELLIIKDEDSKVHLYQVPVYRGKYLMPDIAWRRFGGECEKFGPDTFNGRVSKSSVIKCHDEIDSQWARTELRWTLDGNNLGEYTQDMMRPKYHLSNQYLVIGKK